MSFDPLNTAIIYFSGERALLKYGIECITGPIKAIASLAITSFNFLQETIIQNAQGFDAQGFDPNN